MALEQNWILPALIAIPLIAGLLCWLIEKISDRLPRWIALIGMVITFILTLVLWQQGNFNTLLVTDTAVSGETLPWAAQFILPWIPSFGIKFHLAMDGLSLLMIALTAFLGIMAVGCSWGEIQRRVGFFHLNLLWSLGGVIGVFLAIDLFLFFFFWELMLLPIYFLIALWGHNATGGKSKEYAATKFFIYTQASGLIMLIGILLLVIIQFSQTGVLSFDYHDLLGVSLGDWEYAIMLCFFIGFAVKLPIFPLHGWLPDAHAQAPTAGSVDLAGILIKTAAFGLLRFVIPLFPNASAQFAPVAITLGMIGVFYGAFLAFAQTDIKRLLAYTSVSHMGFVVLAIYAGTLVSLQGLMVQMLAHGLSSAALFIMAGQIYERLHTRDMTVMGGMWGQFRRLAPFMMFFCAALLGIPGTGNFIGEILILMGSFAIHPIFVTLATVSLVMAGLYSLIIIYHALFGQNTTLELVKQNHGTLKDLGKRELALLLSLAIGLVWLGLYPQPVMDKSEGSMQWIASAYAHDVIMADEPMYGIRLIEGNMGDYMHTHHHQLHGQGYDAGIHHHKGSDDHHHDHSTKQGE
ncbi:NADH-quinone oxidoreductase subunit M [Moraxella catarrhalis]|uniref:NADH-quinone oxidoreductase subunit M n=1 Tax=Moraxella catarrhalis TaxID=480 RepID=UPI000EAA886A|nr:NADH-quinone oxidoreductase subunit M [Moraxella catarrhalis]MPX37253.1 NADH-quinone oxidoreductase subunit M [Moraxella catarrhalis]MPX62597.1 NADH-quinone oxidoreductase subunit M [Moraxella catarrhalis]MPX69375.1 NADH-quinone oxidoreductase subunit M [Moraxella catarrhalis]RKM21328.1 NADH-quinone oxidoreductase subunit M [Moraxella catarrhalis]RKM23035.1 NADH-quinone oxidoreductase subunit M [Moraxella catarrhalis]